MTKQESATAWMERTARDNAHGYDQRYRWGEKGDYDCSGAVITAWKQAGVPVDKAVTVKGRTVPGATYTGNLRAAFVAHGFKDVTSTCNLKTGKGLKRGDVLLRQGHHVAQYCGKGMEVEASINEKGTTTGGKPGDQTGKEFLIRSYRNYPWDTVLRYTEKEARKAKKMTDEETITKIAKEVIAGKWGTGDERRIRLTAAGYNYRKVQAKVNKLLK